MTDVVNDYLDAAFDGCWRRRQAAAAEALAMHFNSNHPKQTETVYTGRKIEQYLFEANRAGLP